MKKLKKFDIFVKEDATATLGNTNGMGNVVSANPSATPGDVAGGTEGSGDIGSTLGTFTKKASSIKKRKKKKKELNKKENFNHEQNKPYDKMYVVRFGDYKYTKDLTK